MNKPGVVTARQSLSSNHGSWLFDLFQTNRYKRSQGRLVRRVTLSVLWIVVAVAAYRLFEIWPYLPRFIVGLLRAPWWRYVVPACVLALGGWLSYRLIQYPRFADFLISVEAEVNKVSWPSRKELFRSSAVVIIVIGLLVVVLFGFDLVLQLLLSDWLGIIRRAS